MGYKKKEIYNELNDERIFHSDTNNAIIISILNKHNGDFNKINNLSLKDYYESGKNFMQYIIKYTPKCMAFYNGIIAYLIENNVVSTNEIIEYSENREFFEE